MPPLPTDAVSAANFLVERLCRPVELRQGERFTAVAETERAIGGDTWFWTDDNAKVLEFLSRPELWLRFPRQTTEILRFIGAMCDGPYMFRRVSEPRLERIAAGGHGEAAYLHSLMRIETDLAAGLLVAGIRFHDERSADHLSLTGNYVEFTHRRRRLRVPVERHISALSATLNGHTLQLRHQGDVRFSAGWQNRRLGRLSYVYTIDAHTMLIEVEASLEVDPAVSVSDVVLTVGHDGLGPGGRHPYYAHIVSDAEAKADPPFAAAEPGRRVLGGDGAGYYAIGQRHNSGDSPAIHSAPRQPGRLWAIEVEVERARNRGRVLACYRFAGPQRGATLVAAEYKMLTGGGLYDRVADYRNLLRAAVAAKPTQGAVRDLSISYDYGVTLNAFAKCYAVCAAGDAPPAAKLSAGELRALFDCYLDYYAELFVEPHATQPNAIFSRDLAFVILGVTTMFRATAERRYAERLARLCEVLLEFEVRYNDIAGGQASGFMMRMDSPRAGYVDCHSAALLALTQAARFVDDRRLTAAIERGLAAFCLETCAVDIGVPRKIDTVSTLVVDATGGRHTENTLWNFKVGLTLRLFAALRHSSSREVRAILARHGARLELFELIMRRQLEASIAAHPDGIEFRTSAFSGETNSETQPWVMLGLLGHPAD